MRRALALATASLAVLSTLVVAAPSQAAVPAPVVVPGVRIGDSDPVAMAVAGGHVFVSTVPNGGAHGPVVASGLTGSAPGAVAGMDGVRGLIASADGERVYAWSWLQKSVDVIDAHTATRSASYVLPDECVPSALVDLGATLWFSYGNCRGDEDREAGVGVIDLASPTPHAVRVTRDRFLRGPYIAGDPSAPTTLIMSAGLSDYSLQRYAVDGTTLTPAESLTPPDCGEVQSIKVSVDGLLRLSCWTSTTSEVSYRAEDLGWAGSLPRESPLATASVGPGGLRIVRGEGTWSVYGADGTLRRSYKLDHWEMDPRLVAWGPDGTLFGASNYFDGGRTEGGTYLHVMASPTAYGTQVMLTRPTSQVPASSNVTIPGALTSADSAPGATAGKQIAVTRTRLSDHATASLPALTTSSTGTFTIVDHVPPGVYLYTATFAGDSGHLGHSVSTQISVIKGTPALTVTVTPAAPRYGQTVTIRARLTSPVSPKVISIYAATAGPTTGRPVRLTTRTAAWDGSVTVTYRMLQPMVFIANSGGDATYNAGSVRTIARMVSDITLAQSGYYATSSGYRLYHHTVNPKIAYSMRPWPPQLGWSAFWTLQRYSGGRWTTAVTVRTMVGKGSGLNVRSSAVGNGTYRLVLAYPGDAYASASTSPATYFKIVN